MRPIPLLLVVFAGCGGGAPVLSDLRLTRSELSAGQETFARVWIDDLEGDFALGLFTVRLEGIDDEIEVDPIVRTARVIDVEAGTVRAEQLLAVGLDGSFDFGAYRLELTLTDERDQESEPVEAVLVIGPPNG